MDMERGRSIGRNEGIWRKGRKGYGGREGRDMEGGAA